MRSGSAETKEASVAGLDATGLDAGGALPAPSARGRAHLQPRLAYDVSHDVVPGGGAEGSGKLQHLLHLQDFLHNAQKIDLREASNVTSSSAEEIRARIADLTYRLDMLGALAKVLTEELEALQAALGPEAPPAGRT